MATWLRHIKLQFGGSIGTPKVEEWSNTIRFKADIGGDDDTEGSITWTDGELETSLEALALPLATWFGHADTRLGNAAQLEWAKLNMIGTDGKQMSPTTHRREVGPTRGQVTGKIPHWYETVALTMRTNTARGRAHSGRIFPPLVACEPEGQSPYISALDSSVMTFQFANLLNTLSDAINSAGIAPNLDMYPVIASPAATTGPNQGGPLLRRVTGVVVDRVGDVQHRRTNRVPRLENYRALVTID